MLITLATVILIAGGYWYQSTAAVCPVPLTYHVGQIDPAFGVTKEDVRQYAAAAEAVWESRVNRNLFAYEDTKGITIQLVYDERQEVTDSEAKQRKELDEQQNKNEVIRSTLETLQARYDELSTEYQKRVTAYKSRLEKHNTEVTTYNDRGGAPPAEFDRLQTEQAALNTEEESLSKIADQLTDLATQINKLADQGNSLVNEYNQGVNKYNQEFGYSREFTQGDYKTSGQIDVYKFSTEPEVVRVLAHEFGHALGLGHVEGTSSVMYYLLGDSSQMPALSSQDLVAYYNQCGKEESVGQKIRRTVREILAKFK